MASKITPGDLRAGMHVWPTARTLLAQPICYQQPRCAIIALHWPYVEVRRAPRRPGTNGIHYPRIGSTGHSSGPHLHFEVHLDTGKTSAEALGPIPWMAAHGAPLDQAG
ncbi:hypothetical protein [Actinoplanes xinjiangensis]|uniref:Peptidase M23-like protein n=1 Tax=Actinoplanes xinjiangensis TaxID=512350 RepID=A0A316EB45_9ACTN|nr:hypothetical protein BC793_15118 [Actinoplanes xinjiangensis]GIF45214.1 hypothetical protein Axi01nite_95250 [Actinoplanes xinjiangensis]